MATIPKVFISYTYDSPEHIAWVENLANKLADPGGIDVTFDKWDARFGKNLPFFMEQGLTNAHLVICICSTKYVEKANKGIGGAGYEKQIMAAQLMENVNKEYIIPVMVNNPEKKMPTFLAGSKYIEFTEENFFEAFKELVYRIHGEDLKRRPAIAPNPFAESKAREIEVNVMLEKAMFKNAAFEGHEIFYFKRNNGVFTIGCGEYEFDTTWSYCNIGRIYAYKDRVKLIGTNPKFGHHPSEEELTSFDFSSRCWKIPEGGVFVLVNKYGKLASVKVLKINVAGHETEYTVEFEYKIYDGLNKN